MKKIKRCQNVTEPVGLGNTRTSTGYALLLHNILLKQLLEFLKKYKEKEKTFVSDEDCKQVSLKFGSNRNNHILYLLLTSLRLHL
jgi:hypothetical protein